MSALHGQDAVPLPSLDDLPGQPGSLRDCTVLLTGAGGGIGSSIAGALAAADANIVLVDRDDAALAAVADATQRAHTLALTADVTDGERITTVVGAAVARFGRVDVVINGAGIIHADPLLEVSLSTWRRVFAVNLDGALLVTQAAARQMITQPVSDRGRRGLVLNISSRAAEFGRPYSPAYGASKAALNHLTMSTCAALAGTKIATAVVYPGDIREGMLSYGLPALAAAQGRPVEQLVAEREFQSPGEFAATVLTCLRVQGLRLDGNVIRPDRRITTLTTGENTGAQ